MITFFVRADPPARNVVFSDQFFVFMTFRAYVDDIERVDARCWSVRLQNKVLSMTGRAGRCRFYMTIEQCCAVDTLDIIIILRFMAFAAGVGDVLVIDRR